MTVTPQQIRQRRAVLEERRRYLEWKSEQPGRLKRQEMWEHMYLQRPYLLGAPDDRVAERFRHILMNVMELGPDGRVRPASHLETTEYMEVFTHILTEYGCRTGRPPDDVIASARLPIARYFEQGPPIAVALFKDYAIPKTPILVKYGKRKFLAPMLERGEIRLANAASYNDQSLLASVRDDETSRTFFIPTWDERQEGRFSMDFRGHHIRFDDDDIVLPMVFEDYYLFSLCEHIHYRMPNDFEADAALIIRDPGLFKQRLISAVLAQHPGWEPLEGLVTYYDPYRDYSKFKVPEMAKHFGYAYQKEFRIAFRPPLAARGNLAPIFLSIGSMRDYADFVTV